MRPIRDTRSVRWPERPTTAVGMAAGLVALAILVALDVALGEQASALVGTYVAAPFIAAILAGPGATVFIGAVAVAAAAASPGSAASLNDTEQLVGVAVIAVGTALAALG